MAGIADVVVNLVDTHVCDRLSAAIIADPERARVMLDGRGVGALVEGRLEEGRLWFELTALGRELCGESAETPLIPGLPQCHVPDDFDAPCPEIEAMFEGESDGDSGTPTSVP